MAIQSSAIPKQVWALKAAQAFGKIIGYVVAFFVFAFSLIFTLPAGLIGILWYLTKRGFFIGLGLMAKNDQSNH